MLTNTYRAGVQPRELYPTDDFDDVAFYADPAACDHIETMCPECYPDWQVDHRVALPAIYRAFHEATRNAEHELRFMIDEARP